MTEDVTFSTGFTLQKGDPFNIDQENIMKNPDEFHRPYDFIPERFDPTSEYYLTPKGKKRHPGSVSSFLGGKRVCLGKTFALMVSKVVNPNFIMAYNFECVDEKHMTEKPYYTVVCLEAPKIPIKISKY